MRQNMTLGPWWLSSSFPGAWTGTGGRGQESSTAHSQMPWRVYPPGPGSDGTGGSKAPGAPPRRERSQPQPQSSLADK